VETTKPLDQLGVNKEEEINHNIEVKCYNLKEPNSEKPKKVV
jgi:hypothetical protein